MEQETFLELENIRDTLKDNFTQLKGSVMANKRDIEVKELKIKILDKNISNGSSKRRYRSISNSQKSRTHGRSISCSLNKTLQEFKKTQKSQNNKQNGLFSDLILPKTKIKKTDQEVLNSMIAKPR